MAQYTVKDPQGQEHVIEGPDDATPDQVIAQAQKLIPSQAMPSQMPTDNSPDLASMLYHGAIEGGAMSVGGSAGGIVGSAAGPVGTAAGAMAGAAAMYPLAKRAAEGIDRWRGIEPPQSPGVGTEFAQGVGMEAAGMAAKPVMGMIGRGLARAGETMSGVKPGILQQAYKQGLGTYLAPSMETAQERFGAALGPEGRAAMKVPASEAFDSTLGRARATATDVGTRIEQGSGIPGVSPISPIEALQARQATDRIISATPVTDSKGLNTLYDWRSKFDNSLTGLSGPIKDASTQYRQAIVKDTLLNPMRLTKSGRPSAFLPMVLGAGSRGVAGALSVAAAASPLLWGAAATTAGTVSGAFTPTTQRAIYAAFVDRITTKQ